MSVEKNPRLRNNRAARDLVVKGNKAANLKNGLPRRFVVIGILIAIPAFFFGARYWSYASTHEDTDDAYVTGYTHQISSRVTGRVEKVLVDDNWHVSAGQPLLELDPRDYEVALEKDRAQLRQSIAQKDQGRAGVEQAN